MNTPADIIGSLATAGQKKVALPLGKLITLGILAGVYIAMGGLLATIAAGGVGGWAAANPSIVRLLAGATFPLGLITVVLVGAELFTGNTATLMPAALRGNISWGAVLRNWGIVYLANLVGALLFDYFLAYRSGVLAGAAHTEFIVRVAEGKVQLSWEPVFWRGVGANWLVCLALWMGLSAKTMLGKVVGSWWPIMAFVAIGFEHSIANMYYLPTGLLYGADVTWSSIVWRNLVPATIGNIVGGCLFVGCVYTYLYGEKK